MRGGFLLALVVFFGVFDLVVGGLGLEEQGALAVFPEAEQDERECCGGGPEFGFARYFGFRFPAEKLGCDEEGEQGPNSERCSFDEEMPDGLAEEDGALQSPD